MPRSRTSELKVGLLLLLALAVLAAGIFFIGEESQLFVRKIDYHTEFINVSGLKAGNPVQLNGVDCGQVERVILPEDVTATGIRVDFSIARRYANRVRDDSRAKIKTLGLLGDKFIEITSGSPDEEMIPEGGFVPAAPATNVDALLASGEDTMENVAAISSSLRTILDRMEKGQGLAGELIGTTETSERLKEAVVSTLENVDAISSRLERGEGPLGRLLQDRELGDRLENAVTSLEQLVTDVREGEGLAPKLIYDPTTAARFDETLDLLQQTAADLAALASDVRSSEGLAQKLLTDEVYAEEVGEDLRQLVDRLNAIAGKLDTGEGTASKLINDPEVYNAVNDILVGIDESKLLRWLIRNRQKKGIEERFEDAVEAEQEPATEEPQPEESPAAP